MGEIGVITEQGDLGLGFNPLSSKDKKAIKKESKDQNQKPEYDKNK